MSRLAIDIGGTWLRYELMGEREFCGKVPTKSSDLLGFIEEAIANYPDIDGIAVSFAGQVYEGVILNAPNITVKTPELQNIVESRYGIPLRLENDLNCAALAESLYWGQKNIVALYSGTGLGSGIVMGGEICRGFRGLAGEIGHVPYRQAPFRCGCGKSNCLELYASGSGLQKWIRFYGSTTETTLEELMGAPAPLGDIAEHYLQALTHAAATLVTLCNPSILVLGGGVIAHNPWVVDSVRERIGDDALADSLQALRIEASRLEEASLMGAKILLDTIEPLE